MQTAKLLLFLIDGRAASWRIRLASKALMAKLILSCSPGSDSLLLIKLRDSI